MLPPLESTCNTAYRHPAALGGSVNDGRDVECRLPSQRSFDLLGSFKVLFVALIKVTLVMSVNTSSVDGLGVLDAVEGRRDL